MDKFGDPGGGPRRGPDLVEAIFGRCRSPCAFRGAVSEAISAFGASAGDGYPRMTAGEYRRDGEKIGAGIAGLKALARPGDGEYQFIA